MSRRGGGGVGKSCTLFLFVLHHRRGDERGDDDESGCAKVPRLNSHFPAPRLEVTVAVQIIRSIHEGMQPIHCVLGKTTRVSGGDCSLITLRDPVKMSMHYHSAVSTFISIHVAAFLWWLIAINSLLCQDRLLAHPPARQIQLSAQTQLQCTLSLILLYCIYGHNSIVWSLL